MKIHDEDKTTKYVIYVDVNKQCWSEADSECLVRQSQISWINSFYQIQNDEKCLPWFSQKILSSRIFQVTSATSSGSL